MTQEYKRSINFQPSITLTAAQTWDAIVSYPNSSKSPVSYRAWEINELRQHIFATHPEYITE
jgi:hypothetical protein